MKNVDFKKLELEAIRKVFDLGAGEIFPELEKEFFELTPKTSLTTKNKASHTPTFQI